MSVTHSLSVRIHKFNFCDTIAETLHPQSPHNRERSPTNDGATFPRRYLAALPSRISRYGKLTSDSAMLEPITENQNPVPIRRLFILVIVNEYIFITDSFELSTIDRFYKYIIALLEQ
jgi:hypothetical protein